MMFGAINGAYYEKCRDTRVGKMHSSSMLEKVVYIATTVL
jgi:hypothetical protein